MDEVTRAFREAHGPAVATLARVFGDLTLAGEQDRLFGTSH